MKLLKYVKMFLGFAREKIIYEKTLKNRKDFDSFMISLNQISREREMLERGIIRGGCPSPDFIAKPGFWSKVFDIL